MQQVRLFDYSSEKAVRDALNAKNEFDHEKEKERMRVKAKYSAAKTALVES